ncbi:hypothetical protein V1520DRAFT_358277 [Lipomyces starkeyi]|uniref:Uncharacterized protein n=1 Tax=Lipomyces starkeyi NRRL Y-11557 TaxID=675824 RepID=A0A1E3QCG1_LIPST|nr:hypothetical protein LIPSTDRAFT_841 [Lipomyces starkeyi NRRL Y-11557]
MPSALRLTLPMDADQPSTPSSGLPQLPRPQLLSTYNLNQPSMSSVAAVSTAVQFPPPLPPPPPPPMLLQTSIHDANQTYTSAFAPQRGNEYRFQPSPKAEPIALSSSLISHTSNSRQQTLATQPKRKAGRPRDSMADSIAHEVKRQNGPPIFSCNFCEATWAHYNPYRVKKHGLDCNGMPEDMRIQLAQEVALKSHEQDGQGSKRTKTDSRHLRSIQNQKAMESLVIESIATAGVPISAMSHSSVRRLFQYANSAIILPPKSALLHAILPSEIDTVCAKVTAILQHGGDQLDSLTLSFDVLTTAFDQAFVYVYGTTRNGRTYCLSGHEFPDHAPAADGLAAVVMADVERIGSSKFVAVIAPKLTLFTSTTAIITSRYPHVVAIEPLDHYFDQLAADLCRYPVVDVAVRTMRLIYGYFHRYGRAEGLLRARLKELGIREGLKPVVVNDPISLYVAGVSMRRCLPALIKVVTYDRQKLNKATNKRQVCDVLSADSWLQRDFVSKLDIVIAVFRPLSEASSRLNSPTATLSDIFIAWVALSVYYRDLFVTCSAPAIVADFRQHIVVQTNLRFSQQFNTFPRAASLLTLAMFLHPTMALHEVLIKSPDQRSRVVHELYAQMSTLNEASRGQAPPSQQHNAILYDDLAKFRHRVDIYARPSVGSPQRYWAEVREAAAKTCSPTGSILPWIAKRLFEINGSNMRRGRIRETLDWVDGNLRDNVSSDLIVGLTQCRHFYMVERANENSAEGHLATGVFGEGSSDDGAADSYHGGQSAGSGRERFDFDFEAEIEYVRDPDSRLVQMYEDDLVEVESTQWGSGSGPSQMYTAATGPQSPSVSLVDGMSSATSRGSPSSAAVAASASLTASSAPASQEWIFEVEKYIVLDNFRRTGYCFETPFGASVNSVANTDMANNMQIPQFPMPQYPQPYFTSLPYSRSYGTQSGPPLQSPVSTSGRTPAMSVTAPADYEQSDGSSSRRGGMGKAEWPDMQRFPDGFDL